MKFKLIEIYNLVKGLAKVTEKELPIKVSYRLSKFLKICSSEMEIMEASRVKLVEKYSDSDMSEKNKKVADENIDKFQEDFTSLVNEEIDIDFEPISINDLGDISISANDLLFISKIIKEN